MRMLVVSKDKGNALAGVAVAEALVRKGAEVTVLLDAGGQAWKSYRKTDEIARRAHAGGFTVEGLDAVEGIAGRLAYGPPPDAIFVTVSASGPPNAELDAVTFGCRCQVPVYGLEEMIGGRHNPGWEEGETPPVRSLKRLFTAMPTLEDAAFPVTVVGPSQLERYRGLDIDAVGVTTRSQLGVPDDAPLVYYSGQPDSANPHVLSRLGEACAQLRRYGQLSELVLVVSRHSRDRNIPDNGPAHRQTLRHIRDRVGIQVLENSPDHADIPADHPDGIASEFRPRMFASLRDLVCACGRRGVVVTGFGTDGVIVAPHLGIPSMLLLDGNGYLFGGLLEREKRMRTLLLLCVPQVATLKDLADQLFLFLGTEKFREDHRRVLRATFPFPAENPADIVAAQILGDLGTAARK